MKNKDTYLDSETTVHHCLLNFRYLINQSIEIDFISEKCSIRAKVIDFVNNENWPRLAVHDLKTDKIKFINISAIESITFIEESLKAFK